MKKSNRVLVTGSSRGFGALTVKSLLNNGHQVVASMRDINGKNKDIANELKKAGAHIVQIDVTNEDSVHAGVQKAVELLGGIDVVVNNAGVGVLGIQEHFTSEDFQKLFDINVFGVQRVNRAVLPYMRESKSGLLIHVSSLLGRMTFPFYGPYNASKWALEALAESYRVELSGFGIESCVVEPGGFPTSFMDALLRPTDQSRNESYGDFAHAPEQALKSFEQAFGANPDQNPQLVADAIVKLIETPVGARPVRTVVDKMGMGDAITPYNDQLEQVMQSIFSAFGMEGMLKVKEYHEV